MRGEAPLSANSESKAAGQPGSLTGAENLDPAPVLDQER